MSAVVIALAALAAQIGAVLVLTLRNPDAPRPMSPALLALARRAGGAREVRIRSADGLLLRGDLLGDYRARPLVVYAHGYRGSRRDGDRLAEALLARGYAVLLFDFRGSGQSEGRFTTAGATEGPDVAAVLDHVARSLGVSPTRCGFVGFSMGAAAGTMASASLRRLGAVVLIAPYTRLSDAFDARMRRVAHFPALPLFAPAMLAFRAGFGVDPADVSPIDRISGIAPAPLLLVGGGDDWRAPPSALRALYARARAPKRLLVLPRGDHGFLADFPTSLTAAIVRHLDVHLHAR